MKSILISWFFLALSPTVFSSESRTSVWFELPSEQGDSICTTSLVGRADGSHYYAPILVFPAELKDQCTLGFRSGSLLISGGRSATIPQEGSPWFIQFRDLQIEGKPGHLYLVRRQADHFTLEVLPFSVDATPKAAGLKEAVLKAQR